MTVYLAVLTFCMALAQSVHKWLAVFLANLIAPAQAGVFKLIF